MSRPTRARRTAALALAVYALGAAGLAAAQEARPGGPPPAAAPAATPLPTAAPEASGLSLEAALEAALSGSAILGIRRMDEERSAYAVSEARARGLPQLSLTASSTYMTNPPEGIVIAQGSLGNSPSPGSQYPVSFPDQDYVLMEAYEPTYFKITTTLEQVIWTWGKIQGAVRVAELDADIAGLSSATARLDLARDLSKAYFGAAMARDSLALLTEADALFAEIVADKEKALAEGAATLLEVLEARSQAAAVSSQKAKAGEALATALEALAYFLGTAPDPASLTTPFRSSLPLLDEEALRAAALASSGELAAARLRAEQARIAEGIRRASLIGLPDISLNVSLDVTGQEIPFVGGNWTDTWDAGVLITLGGRVQLFDGLSSVWRLKQAEIQAAQAGSGAAELERSIALSLRRLVDAARVAAARAAEKEAAAALAGERARVATSSFENELLTRGEERLARIGAVTADLERLAAAFELELCLIDLERAVGSPVR